MFDPRKLVTDKGEIDRRYLVEEGRRRAMADYGGVNPPPCYCKPHIQNLEIQAHFVRADWRRDHNLVDDTCYVRGFDPPPLRRAYV